MCIYILRQLVIMCNTNKVVNDTQNHFFNLRYTPAFSFNIRALETGSFIRYKPHIVRPRTRTYTYNNNNNNNNNRSVYRTMNNKVVLSIICSIHRYDGKCVLLNLFDCVSVMLLE